MDERDIMSTKLQSTLDPNVAMMQAFLTLANNQNTMNNQNEQRFDSLEKVITILSTCIKDIEKSKSEIQTAADVEQILDNYMQIKPEDVALVNTMGYTLNEDVDVIQMKEIKARLNRLAALYDRSFITAWEKRLFELIGKNKKEIKLEAQMYNCKRNRIVSQYTIFNAVESIPEYMKWATTVLLEIEKKNNVFERMYTRGDLFQSMCNEFSLDKIELLSKDEFVLWLTHRILDVVKMCRVDGKTAKQMLYNAFKFEFERRIIYRSSGYAKKAVSNYTGDMVKDLSFIASNPNSNLRSYFINSVKKCLVI